jgi:hypothetical protein
VTMRVGLRRLEPSDPGRWTPSGIQAACRHQEQEHPHRPEERGGSTRCPRGDSLHRHTLGPGPTAHHRDERRLPLLPRRVFSSPVVHHAGRHQEPLEVVVREETRHATSARLHTPSFVRTARTWSCPVRAEITCSWAICASVRPDRGAGSPPPPAQ